MSFLSDVKTELCAQRIEKKHLALAECYGILLYCSTFSASEIRIITASDSFAARLPRLFRKAFGLSFDRLPESTEFGKKYSFLITSPEKLSIIFEAFGADPDRALSQHVNLAVLEEDGCRAAFIRGAFLAGGSATDPEKAFHLELATSHHSINREVYSILLDMDLSPKESLRRGNSLLYFKQSEAIADFFISVGASSAAMEIMTARVDREMRNTITRQINCDSANADKIVAAAQLQVAAIKRIMEGPGLDYLPEPLHDTALLRVTNPVASLSELATLSLPKASRGAIAHRLKKIVEISEQLQLIEEEK